MVQIEDVCLATTHRLGHEVYFLTRGEVAYLADLDRGRFYGLDAVGAEMVALLLGRGESATVERIAREYDVEEGRVRSNLDALLGDLGRRGLLVPVGGGAGRAGSRLSRLGWGMLRRLAAVALRGLGPRSGRESEFIPPSRGAVTRLLVLAWASLRLRGYAGSVALWQGGRRPLEGAIPPRREEAIRAVDRAVRDAAARIFLPPIDCKERALVAYHLLREAYGLPATLVIGVDFRPFRAHAWVECDGLVVTDDREKCEAFTPVARHT
jgi:hypothetical protein